MFGKEHNLPSYTGRQLPSGNPLSAEKKTMLNKWPSKNILMEQSDLWTWNKITTFKIQIKREIRETTNFI